MNLDFLSNQLYFLKKRTKTRVLFSLGTRNCKHSQTLNHENEIPTLFITYQFRYFKN